MPSAGHESHTRGPSFLPCRSCRSAIKAPCRLMPCHRLPPYSLSHISTASTALHGAAVCTTARPLLRQQAGAAGMRRVPRLRLLVVCHRHHVTPSWPSQVTDIYARYMYDDVHIHNATSKDIYLFTRATSCTYMYNSFQHRSLHNSKTSTARPRDVIHATRAAITGHSLVSHLLADHIRHLPFSMKARHSTYRHLPPAIPLLKASPPRPPRYDITDA